MINLISAISSRYDKDGLVSECLGYLKPITVEMDRGLSICYIPYSIIENSILQTILIDRIDTFNTKEFILLIDRIRQRIPIFNKAFFEINSFETTFKTRNRLEIGLQRHINIYSTAFPVDYNNNTIMYQYGCNFFDDVMKPLLIPCYAISLYNGNIIYGKDLNLSYFRKVKCINVNIYNGKETVQKKVIKEFNMTGEKVLINENDICNFIVEKPE